MDHPVRRNQNHSMTRDDKHLVFAGFLVALPVVAWLSVAAWRYGIDRPVARGLARIVKLTPRDDFLIGALVLGLVAGFFLGDWLVRRFDTQFGGAAFKRFLRGTRMISQRSLQKLTAESGKAQVLVAGTPIPTWLETLHLLVAGATGTGKTVGIAQIIETLLRRGDRAIIVDPNGAFLSRFYFPGDVVLNPFDKRSEAWSIFNELRDEYDFKRYALSVVPEGLTDEAEEWNGYARLLFQAATKKMAKRGNTTVVHLIKLLTAESEDTLKEFLADTEAEGLFVGAKEALSSARFILAKYLDPHRYLKDAGKFSIRRWLEDEGGGNLYITWREDMLEALKPLVSTWVDILCTSILSLPESPARRLWMVIDELDSLQKLPSLEDSLTKGRKHGLRIVAGIQSTAQLERTNGEKDATVLRSCFRNILVLGGGRSDSKTAEDLSKSLGEHEVERETQGESSNDRGGSRSRTTRIERERVVMPSEIQSLPELTGYLGFAGDLPIARVELVPRHHPMRHPAIVE
jgi:type IV secretory pathway TraG/TraD family ATPase VirD4